MVIMIRLLSASKSPICASGTGMQWQLNTTRTHARTLARTHAHTHTWTCRGIRELCQITIVS